MNGERGGNGTAARRGGNSRRTMLFAGAAILAVFGILIAVIVNVLSSPAPPSKPEVRQVNVVRPPPPPPEEEPPPPPEQPEIEEEVETPEEPEPVEEVADAEPPPGDLLGLDADGVAGGDAFGLAARKGGRSITSGGGGGSGFLFGEVERAIQDRLTQVNELRAATYEVPAEISFSSRGCVDRVALQASTGDQGRDRLLRESVTGICVENARTAERLASRTVKLKIASR